MQTRCWSWSRRALVLATLALMGSGACETAPEDLRSGGGDGRGGGGSGGLSGGNPCAACADDEICVSDTDDAVYCTPRCTDDSDCPGGCCRSTLDGQWACASGVRCGGTGGAPDGDGVSGPQCESRTGCVSVREWLGDSGFCRANDIGREDGLPVMANSCDEEVWCRVCGVVEDTLTDQCEEGPIPAFDAVGGWASYFVYCDVTGVRWSCISEESSIVECKAFIQF